MLQARACGVIVHYAYMKTVQPLSRDVWHPAIVHSTKPPKQLFIRGEHPVYDPLFKTIAIVGSRNCTTYGITLLESIIARLRGFPLVIASGLAHGIDSYAHHYALNNGLACVALPGSGLDDSVLYPTKNKNLAYRILNDGGYLLSPFEPLQQASNWTFPVRNRILASMSDAVLVIEATKKSGSLITARYGLEENKHVWAIPGDITKEQSSGTNWLLQEGAYPILEGDDILKLLDFTPVIQQKFPEYSSEERLVLDILAQPRTKSDLLRLLPFPHGQSQALISRLEMKRYIIDRSGIITRQVLPERW